MSTIDNAVEVSIVVPVFNEEENVVPLSRELTSAMNETGRTYEIVFVDDASTDDSWYSIQEANQENRRVRGLRHRRNSGQSAAVWTGIQATQGPIVVTLDGDRQNDPADLPRLLREVEQCDMVCGVRARRNDSTMRLISTRIARWARRTALKVDFCDTGCAFRVFKREALQGIFPFNGLHRFLPVLAHANGANVREVPISHRPRVCGASKYGVWNRLWRGIYDLIAIVWYQKRRIGRIDYVELDPSKPVGRSRRFETPDAFALNTPAPKFPRVAIH